DQGQRGPRDPRHRLREVTGKGNASCAAAILSTQKLAEGTPSVNFSHGRPAWGRPQNKMIYLDNSATTRQYDEVTEAMVRAMKEDYGNPSSLYQLGVDAEKALKAARRQVLAAAGGCGAANGDGGGFGADSWEVVFTSGGTEADNMAIFGAARALRRLGNRIVTTAIEHPAVLECCKSLETEGFEVVRVGVGDTGLLLIDEMREAINDRTILVSMMHVNNEVGTVMPVGLIREIMEQNGAPGLYHCDAVQSFGKMPLPADADLISVSGHKIHGPKGSGALLISKGPSATGAVKAANIPAFIVGGGQESGRRSGTENVPAIVGLGCAAQIAAADGATGSNGNQYLSMAEIAGMRQKLMDGLCAEIDDIELNSPFEGGTVTGMCCPSVLNVSFKGTRGEVILHTLEQEGICVSTGSACSSNKKGQSHVLQAMGRSAKDIEGAIRFSIGRLNSPDEVDTVVDAVATAVKRFRRLGSFR
ncbi:MAG: cysteine desulfurase family protein, partial [Eggerthellaceae bacterium]|nr:cysteine desulfurase family protein [Eggerthellaceae bacterium]